MQSVASIPCNICGSSDTTVIGTRSRSGAPLRSVACRRCGLSWSDPRPHQVRQFYEEDYRQAYKGTIEPKRKHVLRAGRVALARLERIRPLLLSRRMRVLDVGSGGGEFAYLLKTLDHEVTGVEPNRGYAEYAARRYGLEVRRGFIGDVELPEGAFDLVTVWHVLEHTEDPGEVLAQLKRSLAPGGSLVVEVPNIEATCQSPASTFHEAHLFNFNPATLALLAMKAGLYCCTSRLTADGGNIVAVFRAWPLESDLSLPGNHEQVAAAVQRHTTVSHLLSAQPYRRLAGRLARGVGEWLETRGSAGPREQLDGLYGEALGDAGISRGPSGRHVLAAYVVAIALEWALLDAFLPRLGWAEWEALGLYLMLQSAIVAGILWMTSRPRTARGYAKLGAWTAPLFALPLYC